MSGEGVVLIREAIGEMEASYHIPKLWGMILLYGTMHFQSVAAGRFGHRPAVQATVVSMALLRSNCGYFLHKSSQRSTLAPGGMPDQRDRDLETRAKKAIGHRARGRNE
jgi:hypothetical protein